MHREQTDKTCAKGGCLIPGWGPNLCHKGASVWRQSLGRGVYGNSVVAPKAGNVAPSDINPLADYVQGAVCVWKKKRKQNIHMLLRASGMRWMQRMDVGWRTTTLRLTRYITSWRRWPLSLYTLRLTYLYVIRDAIRLEDYIFEKTVPICSL